MSATPLIPLELGTPSLRQLQSFIREKQEVELKLLTGDLLSGQLFWQDPDCLCLRAPNGSLTTVWKQSLAYLRPIGELKQPGSYASQTASDEEATMVNTQTVSQDSGDADPFSPFG